MLLQDIGHDAAYVCDPAEALGLARTFRPEIALLDIGMPSIDGYELARAFRRTPELVAVRLVALTGRSERGDYKRSREAGFDAHVVKPADIPMLKSIIAQFDT